jgi:putative Mn2+ efflux pump MntP
MPLFELVLIALAMGVDAFTVCLAAASSGQMRGFRPAFRLSFHFGFFQFLMPVLGWLAGSELQPLIEKYDHWIAFVLLAFVGVRMIQSAFGPSQAVGTDPSRGLTLILLSIAVSIDALAVGLTLGFLGISVWYPALLIGLVTSALSLAGLRLGAGLGRRLGRPFIFVGGLLLIGIGVRIVVAHLARI